MEEEILRCNKFSKVLAKYTERACMVDFQNAIKLDKTPCFEGIRELADRNILSSETLNEHILSKLTIQDKINICIYQKTGINY